MKTEKNRRVLIVDDDPVIRETLSSALRDDFEVTTRNSGEDCLKDLTSIKPDAILLDINMSGMDGLETCRRIREHHDFPVIFISASNSLEQQLLAFDAGGDDFVSKPFNAEVLFRQLSRIIQRYRTQQAITQQHAGLQDMTLNLLRDIGRTDVLLAFMRHSIGCSSYEQLAHNLLDACQAYGVDCHVQVRHADEVVTLTHRGPASPIEESVFERCALLGRVFHFRRRMIINFPAISILILALPEEAELAQRIQEKITVLAESGEAICETVHIRKESALRAEALQLGTASSYEAIGDLREKYREQQQETRTLLQLLIDDVERAYVFLGLTERQESIVSETIRARADEILRLFELGVTFDAQFESILESLMPKNNRDNAISLF